ncbi:hypothetical protein Rhopal_001885-T1 [Rhodotorula paludigena]|uniref:ATP-dependent RNA helicase n=1 Tax=Rhodotorula paludigena TaxID=86838 RepID=A0AAV5GEH0_9BASI|nr:hypothetical protein Rhopal_001885-T1 [Rhodotorula paludigena]
MSAPAPPAQQGQKKRHRPYHRNRKPKPAQDGSSAPATASPAAPSQAQPSAAATPLSLASTVTTPSQTPRAATPAGAAGAGVVPGSALSKTFSSTRFADFAQQGLISQQTARGIASGGYEYCTEVQAMTLPVCLTGVDARTGTGKTLAFLIPSIENLLRAPTQPPKGQISVLVLSPTRELAIQIEESAKTLLSGTPYKVQHVVGGTNMNAETKRLNNERCDFLIATPGRLLDHLQNAGLKPKLSGLRTLIFDEADRLLEQGFRQDCERIISHLPNRAQQPRQTLLFSATIPAQVHQLGKMALLPSHQFVSTIPPDEENTHESVPQFALTPPSLLDLFPQTLALLRSEIATHGAATKVMVFLPTARATGLVAALFKRVGLQQLAPGFEVYEIHSRKSQSQRNAAAEAFKVAQGGVLFSSDVTARGMDFPNVTTVIQLGVPASAEQYIHRLGRTARAGSTVAGGGGVGMLILAPFETFFLRRPGVSSLPLQPHPLAQTALAPGLAGGAVERAREDLARAMPLVDDETKGQMYSASIGFYKGVLRDAFRGSAQELVRTWNEFATTPAERGGLGCAEVPGMLAQTVGKMGLKGTPGLRIVSALPGKEGGNGRGGGGGGGGRGGRGGGGGGGGRGGAGRGRGGGRGGARGPQ